LAWLSCHEVTLGELELVRETLLLGVMCGTLDLIVVVVQANDVDARELDNLTRGSSDTASDVEHTHVVLKTHLVCKVVLVASNGLVEGLAIGIAAEVEALAPTVLIQVGREVVVVPCESGIFVSSFLVLVSICGTRHGNQTLLTLRVSSVSSEAALLSQCLKYSSTAACWAPRSFWSIAAIPPRVVADLPCMALLNSASRVWSSCSSAMGDMLNVEVRAAGLGV
jgi:hypothetical protein